MFYGLQPKTDVQKARAAIYSHVGKAVTERLYYNDSRLLEFDARLVRVDNEAGKYLVVLDRSAFYPTSGGQMHDLGTLNEIAVTDVIDGDGGEVVHVCEASPGQPGDKAHGAIDAERRLRHTRQHTAQHIISQAFDRLYGLLTVSVHLGEDYGAVELETPELSTEHWERAELMCQEVIEADFPIQTRFYEEAELAGLPLRKPPAKSGKIRIITIADYECSACGGTHCRSTAEVMMIKFIGIQKLRGHALVKFLSGRQCFEDYRGRFDVTEALSRDLTCHYQDLPPRLGRLAADLKDSSRAMGDLYRQLLPIKAEQIAADTSDSQPIVAVSEDIADQKLAARLAAMISEKFSGPILILNRGRLHVAVGNGFEPGANQIAQSLAKATDLKGGGNARLAQLGPAGADELDQYRRLVMEVLDRD